MWNTIKCCQSNGSMRRKGERKEQKNIKEIMAENLPNLEKNSIYTSRKLN